MQERIAKLPQWARVEFERVELERNDWLDQLVAEARANIHREIDRLFKNARISVGLHAHYARRDVDRLFDRQRYPSLSSMNSAFFRAMLDEVMIGPQLCVQPRGMPQNKGDTIRFRRPPQPFMLRVLTP